MKQTRIMRQEGTARLRATTIVVATLLALACGDSSTGPAGATWSGSIALQDTWGNALDDLSGVVVSVDGLSLQGISDKSGSWRIEGVPGARHDLTFTKAGFGTMRAIGKDADGAADTVFMASTPTVQALIDSIYVSTLGGTEFYRVDGHFSQAPPANAKSSIAVIFVARDESVSPDPAKYEQWNASFSVSGGAPDFIMLLPVIGTRSTFGAGTRLFVAGYANSVACSCYNDPATGRRVFSNTGPRGNVVQFTVK